MTARHRLVDGGLATLLLAAVAVLWVAVDAAFAPVAAVLGGLGSVVLELSLSRRRKRVRRLWDRPGVKPLALAAGTALAVAAALVAPHAGLSALGGGLVAYLLLLVGTEVTRFGP